MGEVLSGMNFRLLIYELATKKSLRLRKRGSADFLDSVVLHMNTKSSQPAGCRQGC